MKMLSVLLTEPIFQLPKEKKIHSRALKIRPCVCLKTEEEKPNNCFMFYSLLIYTLQNDFLGLCKMVFNALGVELKDF